MAIPLAILLDPLGNPLSPLNTPARALAKYSNILYYFTILYSYMGGRGSVRRGEWID